MKNIIPLLCITLAALGQTAFADFIIEEKMERTDGPPQDITIKMKGDKGRIDMGSVMSTISNGSTGEITMLMHAQKAVVGLPLLAMAGKAKQADNGPHPKLEPTGRKEKINGYDTEEYTHEIPSLKTKTHYWIAKSFPDAVKILQQMETLQGPAVKEFTRAAGALQPEDYPGLPIRTETESDLFGKSTKMTITIVSIKNEPVDDSVFIVPADYKKTDMPTIPGPPPSSPSR